MGHDIIRPWFAILVILCLLTACTSQAWPEMPSGGNSKLGKDELSVNEESSSTEAVAPAGLVFSITLKVTEGTGFEWMIIYQTENLTLVEDDYLSPAYEHAETGGTGTRTMAWELTDGEKAYLIIDNTRPWEEGFNYYQVYTIWTEDGQTVQSEMKEYNTNFDFEIDFVETDAGYLGLQLLDGWQAEQVEDAEHPAFLIRPEGEKKSIQLVYNPDYRPGNHQMVSPAKIRDIPYVLVFNKRNGALEAIVSEGEICVISEGAAWANEHFLEIVVMLDASFMEYK